jgi:uridine phosphorylase
MNKNTLPNYSYGDFIPYLNLNITKNVIHQFSNIKYVILQGSGDRTLYLANKLLNQIPELNNLLPNSSYVAYKVGNILLASHGMGSSSILTLLNTLTPLLKLCNNNFAYIRIGTSGGIGIKAGTVVLTKNSYTADIINGYPIFENNNKIIYPTTMNLNLNQDIIKVWLKQSSNFSLIEANTMCADDFYLSQARMDGFIRLDFDNKKQKTYLNILKNNNIANIEMESGALGYFSNLYNIPATTISATIVNRLKTDQVTISPEMVKEYSQRGQIIIMDYLKNCE